MYSNDNKRLTEIHQQRLYEYITSGRLYKIRLLLEDENYIIDINRHDENGQTPLMLACTLEGERTKTRNQLLRLLLDKGADLNTPDQKGVSVFSWACKTGKIDLVKLFVQKSAVDIDYNAHDSAGDTALMYAVRAQNTSLVRILVRTMNKLGVDIDKRNNSDVTPYLEAKRMGEEELMDILKNEGNASDSVQICPLFLHEVTQADEIEVDSSMSTVRPTLASKMRQALSKQSRKEWIQYKKSWNKSNQEISLDDIRNKRNVEKRPQSCPAGKSCNSFRNLVFQRRGLEPNVMERVYKNTKCRKNEETRKTNGDVVGDKHTITSTGNGKKAMGDKDRDSTDVISDKSVTNISTLSNSVEQKSHTGFRCNNSLEVQNERDTKGHKGNKSTDQPSVTKTTGRPLSAVSDRETRLENSVCSEDGASECVGKTGQSAWQKQLPKRSAWKKKLSTNEQSDKLGHTSTRNNPPNNHIGRMMQDKLAAQSLRDCTMESQISFSRPNSGYSSNGGRVSFADRRPASAVVNSRFNFSYEDVYEICPEMQESSRRQWYSDLRWMLALKAHQNNPAYLPAQPQRPASEDMSVCEVKLEVEMPRSRRPSMIGDIKRPGLKKRQTTSVTLKTTQS